MRRVRSWNAAAALMVRSGQLGLREFSDPSADSVAVPTIVMVYGALSVGLTILLLLTGVVIFNKVENTFIHPV
jgi:hypothetical protein